MLSYKGLLFRRIAVKTGFTYGNSGRISDRKIQLTWGADYEDRTRVVYKRNECGYWGSCYETFGFNKEPFKKALDWLEKEGLIHISRGVFVCTHYAYGRGYRGFYVDMISLTDKGKALAPAYLKKNDPFPKGNDNFHFLENGVDLAGEF